MYNKKELKKTERKQDKSNPFNKDIIYDPRGQWDNPGENTRVQGGTMTMQGVPYSVYGVPYYNGTKGQGVMMQSGQDYIFKDKNGKIADYVDEFPQLEDGGNAFLDAFTRVTQNFNRPNSKIHKPLKTDSKKNMQITGTAWNGDPVYNDVNDPNYIQSGWGLDTNGNIPGTNIRGSGIWSDISRNYLGSYQQNDKGFDSPISEWQRQHPNNDRGFDAWPTRPSTGYHDPSRPWLFEDGGSHQMPDGTWMLDEEHEEYEEVDLTKEEIQAYRDGGYVVEEYHEGGTVHNKEPHPHHGGEHNDTPEEYNAWVKAGNQVVRNSALEKEWRDYNES